MSSRIEKQFSNAATTPILITMSFELNDDKIIERIDAAGGTVPQNDIAKAEQQRMVRWVRDTFIGQHEFFLNAHNGNVPAPGFTETSGSADPLNLNQRDRRFVVVNTIDFSPEAVAKAMQGTPGLIDRILRRDFEKQRNQTTVGAASDKTEARAVSVGHPNYEFAPKVGTYWQDRNRTVRFFVVVSTHECDGHSHVRMLRVDNQRGGEYEWAFTTPSAWNEMFAPTTSDKVPGLTPYSAQRVSLDALQPVHYALDPEDAEKLLHDFHEAHPEIGDFFRQFLDNVPFEGSEQPPQPGERYYSYISNKTYTVVDARRKLHSQDYYITMDRDEDGHRTKFTYRNHAEWLTVWRPVDDEGNPRKVFEVDIEQQPSRMHRPGLRPNEIPTILTPGAEVLGVPFEPETDAERHLRIIYRELDRKVPGWRNMGAHYENIDDVGLALRAIRSINKHMLNYQQIANTATSEVSKLSDKNRELSSLLGVRTRELDKLKQERGGAWDAARVRREQDTMRELLRHYALLFVRHHGRATLKRLLAELDAETLLGLPHEHFMLLVTRCEAYSDRQGG